MSVIKFKVVDGQVVPVSFFGNSSVCLPGEKKRSPSKKWKGSRTCPEGIDLFIFQGFKV